MGEFRCPDDFPSHVIGDGKSSRFCSWIDLKPERRGSRLLNFCSQDDSERIAPIYGGPALLEQVTCPCWMHLSLVGFSSSGLLSQMSLELRVLLFGNRGPG